MKKLFAVMVAIALVVSAAIWQARAADLVLLPMIQFFDTSGNPLNGGKLYFYETGTTTPKDVYLDSTGATVLTQPVTLNSAGYPSSGGVAVSIYLDGIYKMVLKTSAGVTLRTIDPFSYSTSVVATVSEWTTTGLTPTYIGASSFSVSGDYTTTFQAGMRLKTTDTGGTDYSTIASSSFAAGVTTVTVNHDTGTFDAGLSAVSIGILTMTNQSLPIHQSINKTALDTTFTVADLIRTPKIIWMGSSAGNFYMPSATNVPSGLEVVVKNSASRNVNVRFYGSGNYSIEPGIAARFLVGSASNDWYDALYVKAAANANHANLADSATNATNAQTAIVAAAANTLINLSHDAKSKAAVGGVAPNNHCDHISATNQPMLSLGSLNAGAVFYVQASQVVAFAGTGNHEFNIKPLAGDVQFYTDPAGNYLVGSAMGTGGSNFVMNLSGIGKMLTAGAPNFVACSTSTGGSNGFLTHLLYYILQRN